MHASSNEEYEAFLHEILLMNQLRHPNIVLFLGACIEYPNISMVTEYVDRGDLHYYLNDTKCTWKTKVGMACDVARGMLFLHLSEPPILHLDLKSLNILVDKWARVKVADFGISRILESKLGIDTTGLGSLNWLAPEMLEGCEERTSKLDVFSFGMVMWEIISEQFPYAGKNELEVLFSIVENQRPEVPEHLDKEYASLMQKCWDQNPEERPDFEEILSVLENIYSSIPTPSLDDNETEERENLFSNISCQKNF